MKKVVVTKGWVGIYHMQVCAVEDATDEEILETCNTENPSGTTHGWSIVIRQDEEWLGSKSCAPISCEDYNGRKHFLVAC